MTDKQREDILRRYRAEDGHYYCHRCPVFKYTGYYCNDHYRIHTEEDCERNILAFEDPKSAHSGSFMDTVDNVLEKYTTAPKSADAPESVVDDPVNHPSHYTAGGVECIDAIYAALGQYTDPVDAWLAGQVIKYLWRAPLKGKYSQDISKAMFYLKRLEGRNEKRE